MANDEDRDEMPYDTDPKTEFQKFIRSGKEGNSSNNSHDHDLVFHPELYSLHFKLFFYHFLIG